MPTSRGWGLLASSFLLGVAGRIFAVLELLVVGAGGLALVVTAVAYVRLTRVSLGASRALHPPRLHAGASGHVEMTVRNTGARPSPVVGAVDPFDHGRRRACFEVAPLRPGQAVRAAYRLPTEQRGIHHVGPLELRLEDPFGVASSSVHQAPATKLVVYPRVEAIEALPPGPPDGISDRAGLSPVAPTVDGDLYALREYQRGDDLRRVHWRSTAKHDELMVRHPETPGDGAATILLDLRKSVHDDESLETAVSAAASIVHAAWRRRWPVRLVTSDGADSGLWAGRPHVDAILERLATADVTSTAPPSGLWRDRPPWSRVDRAKADGTGGIVVMVTTEGSPAGDLRALGVPGSLVVRVAPGLSVAAAWAAAVVPGRPPTPVGG